MPSSDLVKGPSLFCRTQRNKLYKIILHYKSPDVLWLTFIFFQKFRVEPSTSDHNLPVWRKEKVVPGSASRSNQSCYRCVLPQGCFHRAVHAVNSHARPQCEGQLRNYQGVELLHALSLDHRHARRHRWAAGDVRMWATGRKQFEVCSAETHERSWCIPKTHDSSSEPGTALAEACVFARTKGSPGEGARGLQVCVCDRKWCLPRLWRHPGGFIPPRCHWSV